MLDTQKSNTSYIFIPFRYDDPAHFSYMTDSLEKNRNWVQVKDEILYMLKYVADKLDSDDRRNCQCFHFELSDTARARFNIAALDAWCSTEAHEYQGEPVTYRFRLQNIHLYNFSTTVCMFAFQLVFESDDPLWISSALYNLKKVSRERITMAGDAEGPTTTLLEIAKKLIAQNSDGTSYDFFFYANPMTERSNVLTYIEVEPKDDYKYELYYLRRCYSDGFLYAENKELDDQELYAPSQDILWGISPEASVCLSCPKLGREAFIHGTFYKNFNAQYLFMYVLLLHQKYVLYMLLTKIGVGTYNDLETLEAYRHQLYEFETDFVFSCVTEVPQYQALYERMGEAFALKKMFGDVREPLLSLGEVRRASAEAEQRKRDKGVDRALFTLSLLSFFSALVDSFDFADAFFGWFLGEAGIKIVQTVFILAIIVAMGFVVRRLFASKRD